MMRNLKLSFVGKNNRFPSFGQNKKRGIRYGHRAKGEYMLTSCHHDIYAPPKKSPIPKNTNIRLQIDQTSEYQITVFEQEARKLLGVYTYEWNGSKENP